MPRTLAEIASDLRAVQPARGSWLLLDELSGELWEAGLYPDALEELLAVFERFPEDDGAGVFWGVLHGLEAVPGYEPALIRSVQRQPSEFGVMMVGRLINGGQSEADGTSLLDVLELAASHAGAPESVRRLARKFLGQHRSGV